MSDLCSSNCGCERDNNYGCGNNYDNRGRCQMSSCLWIILLLIFCGGNSWGCGGNSWGRGGDCDCGDNNCLWIILLLIFCGCGNFGGCGC